jgi:hypothetical protein
MKTRLFLLFLAAALFGSPGANAGAVEISANDAFTVVKNMFQGQDVDYYLRVETGTSAYWYIYVDAEPTKGWNHDCYFYQIAKRQDETTPIDSIVPRTKVKLQHPPKNSTFLPLSVKNRYGDNSKSKPVVKKVASANAINNNEVASRTYAVILSGGYNEYSNYERYWNDCSFLYQTLVNKYQIPKSNVYALMADGDDPEADMLSTSGVVVSQSLDLDFDGSNEISYAASKANVKSVLAELAGKLQEDDHLLFYVIDHGGSTDNASASYIWLWKYEQLFDYELAEMLAPFSANNVNVNVVLGQCFSGGFIDDLQSLNCVVSTACRGDEYSYACSTIPYDEFVYRWTSAINEANHTGTAITSDADSNGRVTMEEAFAYAKANDTRDETPQYLSTPLSIGEDLAMNHLAPAVDIYIKDDPLDMGCEPNNTTDKFWLSPSIWVRNQDDSIAVHENPEYSKDHQLAFVYVRIYNRGKKEFDGTQTWAHIYWALASSGFTSGVWKGTELMDGKYTTGGHLEAIPIPAIAPGDSAIVKLRWALPQLLEEKFNTDERIHFCLFCKLMHISYDDGYIDGKSYFFAKASNDQAQKNVSVILRSDTSKETCVYVRNVEGSSCNYSLEFVPRTSADSLLYSHARVVMKMSPQIYSAWERGGMQREDLTILTTSDTTATTRVKFNSPSSRVKAISMNSNEYGLITMKVSFRLPELRETSYTYDLIQRDEDGNIIGGETFIIEAPYKLLQPPTIVPTTGNDSTTLTVTDASSYDNVQWVDATGEIISTEESVTVSPTKTSHDFTALASTEDGGLATASISLEVSSAIESLSVNSSSVTVNLSTPASDGATIAITSSTTGSPVMTVAVTSEEQTIKIDISSLQSGVYTLTYIEDGAAIDSKNFTK